MHCGYFSHCIYICAFYLELYEIYSEIFIRMRTDVCSKELHVIRVFYLIISKVQTFMV